MALIETKICARCRKERSLRLFGWLKRHNRGKPEAFRDAWCLECRRDYKKTPNQRAKSLERLKIRRMTDPAFREQCSKWSADYYQRHRARILERQKNYVKRLGRGNAQLGHLSKRLRDKFGISLDDYNALLERQNFRCKICDQEDRTKARRLAVDHDHETGAVRALLCHHCNTGLGNFGDNPALLWKALQYILTHKNAAVKNIS